MKSNAIICRALRGFALLVVAAIATTSPPAAAQQGQPNIVYIVADDLGFADVGYKGSPIATPSLDKLANSGARLSHFYVQPLCTPTRAALMTGRYPFRYGLQTGVIPAAGRFGLPLDETTLPQMLKGVGYRTAIVGKWHLGHGAPEYWPTQRGFDSFFGTMLGEIDHFTLSAHGVRDWWRDNQASADEGFSNILMSDEAVQVIGRHDASKPLFLYLAYTAPHTPFQAPKEWLARHSHIKDDNARAYAALISILDDGVGRVVKALEDKGMRENTLIVFHSDDGGVTSAKFSGDTKVQGKLPASNAPLRDGKGTLYEGGTRVVAFANWPGHVKPQVVDGMINVADMFPTLVALAGAKPAGKPLDGVNVWSTMSEGAPSPRHEIVYNVDAMGGAVRDDRWKLIWTATLPQRVELFDLQADPSERTDLSAQYTDVVKRKQARISELAGQMAPSLLFFDALRLTFGTPPVTGNPSELFSQGD